ncbi:RNA polymerase sigma factor [Planomonospora algeriensis]
MVDQHTIEAVLAGDQDAWDVVVKRFGPLVWSVVRAHGLSAADASDIVQGTWLRFLESLSGIRDPERIASWLCTTARREAALLLRRSRGEQLTAEPVEPADPTGHSADPVLAVLAADEGRRLWRAVESMDEPCRSLFRLMATAPDAGVRQLAGRLGMPTGSYGPTRRRCLDRLRSLLVPQEAAS